MVELTLNWNHVTQVLGPNGNLTYPAQLLPLMIGALSFLRICWLLFKRWQFPEQQDCCEEKNQVAPQRTGMCSRGAPFDIDTPQVGLGGLGGLGLLSSPSAHAHHKGPTNAVVGQQEEYNTRMVRHRNPVKRYLVAYLPWLSQFEFWKTPPKGHGNHPPHSSTVGEDGKAHHHHDSPLTPVGPSLKEVEYADLHVRSVAPSSTHTSPMIDMKL
jgi:hypothetical protein